MIRGFLLPKVTIAACIINGFAAIITLDSPLILNLQPIVHQLWILGCKLMSGGHGSPGSNCGIFSSEVSSFNKEKKMPQ